MKVVENGLIPVYENKNKEQLVNARELHEFLEVGTKFTDWIKDRIKKYGFNENEDFIHVSEKKETRTGATVADEYILTLDTAKEISMEIKLIIKSIKRLARLKFLKMKRRASK